MRGPGGPQLTAGSPTLGARPCSARPCSARQASPQSASAGPLVPGRTAACGRAGRTAPDHRPGARLGAAAGAAGGGLCGSSHSSRCLDGPQGGLLARALCRRSMNELPPCAAAQAGPQTCDLCGGVGGASCFGCRGSGRMEVGPAAWVGGARQPGSTPTASRLQAIERPSGRARRDFVGRSWDVQTCRVCKGSGRVMCSKCGGRGICGKL